MAESQPVPIAVSLDNDGAITLLRRKRLIFTRVLIAICIPGALLNFGMAVRMAATGGIDFNQFYSAAQLTGTGHLYDLQALGKLETPHGIVIPTARLPVVIYGWKILNAFPYPLARSIWLAMCFGAVIVFAALWPETDRRVMLAALTWSMPLSYLLVLGQDTPVWLMFFALALALLAKDRPRLAGIAFALCICKFHLAIAIPVFLTARKLWTTMLAGAAATAAMLAACFLIEGRSWPARYLAITHVPELSPAVFRMPNLYGLASRLPAPEAVECIMAVALVALLWAMCRPPQTLGIAGASAAACGLLLGRHAYASDLALLIPLAVITIQNRRTPVWLRIWAAVALTPAPIMLLGSPYALYGQAIPAGFAVAVLVLEWVRNKPRRTADRSAEFAPAC